MANAPIYLDHNATTPVDPRVLEAMLPCFTEHFGNAASRDHAFGDAAQRAVELARGQASALIGADPREIVFTSGATESNNLALKGVANQCRDKGRHIITSALEHKAVIDPCRRLEQQGFEVTWLTPRPGSDGVIAVEQVAEALRDDTVLVSIMWANNEIGTINDVPAIARLCEEKGMLFHTDATQYVGRLPVDVQQAGIDLLSASAHKFYGPKGAGFLYVRRRGPRVRLEPMLEGGGHERGMRSGTLNVPGIVGLGKACAVCAEEMTQQAERLRELRDRLEASLGSRLEGVRVHGQRAARLPQTSNMSFAGVESESLILAIRPIAVSAGAACSSASLQPSHVLRHLGVDDDEAHSSIRFSLGWSTTAQQIDTVIETVVTAVQRLRALSPLWDGQVASTVTAASGTCPQPGDWNGVSGSRGNVLLLDHFDHPRHVGELDPADAGVGIGEVGAAECGDLLKLCVKVDDQSQKISAARFKAFGSAGTIAAGSIVCERLHGRTLGEALELDDEQLAAELGLPPERRACALLASQALRQAVLDYRGKQRGRLTPAATPGPTPRGRGG